MLIESPNVFSRDTNYLNVISKKSWACKTKKKMQKLVKNVSEYAQRLEEFYA